MLRRLGRRGVVALLACKAALVLWWWRTKSTTSTMNFSILATWDGRPIDHDPVRLTLTATQEGMVVDVLAPFFNDPPNPGGPAGKPFQNLWDYEVVEAFFLGADDQYLELEFCPHGQHLVLMLRGVRKPFKDQLPLAYSARIGGDTWTASALVPWDYFPPRVQRINAYAIHGSDEKRVYESLAPVPSDTFPAPDFHRLDFFKEVDLSGFWPDDDSRHAPSSHWRAPIG